MIELGIFLLTMTTFGTISAGAACLPAGRNSTSHVSFIAQLLPSETSGLVKFLL